MPSRERKLGETIRDLATAILDAGHLIGDERHRAGVNIERRLKDFAEVVLGESTLNQSNPGAESKKEAQG
jgi:hypothetical protein